MQTQGTQVAALSFAHAEGWYLRIPLIHGLPDGPRLWDPMRKRSSQNTENSPKTSLTFIRNIRPPFVGPLQRANVLAGMARRRCTMQDVVMLLWVYQCPEKMVVPAKFNQHSKCHPQLRTQKSA